MESEKFESSNKPYTFLPDSYAKKKKTASSTSSTTDHIDRMCGSCTYNPLLFDGAMCIPTTVLKELQRKRYRHMLKKNSIIQVLSSSEPHTFENYIPPPPPLFEGEEILLCDEEMTTKM